jgi:2-dehydro-3-deoxy-D-gluconate 5-dehydrogenase
MRAISSKKGMRMTNLFDLSGRVAVVTGSSRGIGRAIAVALAEAGADMVLVQRSAGDIGAKREIEGLGRRCGMIECDMADASRARNVVGEAARIFGRLDILVNNAGIQRACAAEDFPEEAWDEVMAVDLKAVFLLCRQAGKLMIAVGGGKIINIASLMSFLGGTYVPAYAAAKGGVAQLTKALANEWGAHGVNVNAIAPGFIATDMTPGMAENEALIKGIPAGRIGTPDDLKGSAVFLASRASDYVNGHVLLVDGGRLWY